MEAQKEYEKKVLSALDEGHQKADDILRRAEEESKSIKLQAEGKGLQLLQRGNERLQPAE